MTTGSIATHPTASDTLPTRMPAATLGSGARIVLVGGGLTGWRSWEPHAERLAANREVARLQLLGVHQGLLDRPIPSSYSVRAESRALAAALDELGWLGPLDLVAWSYGGVVTLDFALSHPERVRTLTLIEPPAVWVLGDQGRDEPDVQRLVHLVRTLPEEIGAAELERFVCTVGLCPPGTSPADLPQWATWMEHRRSLRIGAVPFLHRDEVGRLHAFERPVMLVTGTGTAPFLRRIHEELSRHLPDARSLELPSGHAPQLVSMDRFLTELERFLDAVH